MENIIASIDQQIVSSSGAADPNTSEQLQNQKKEVEDERVSKAADEEERKKIIGECREKIKES